MAAVTYDREADVLYVELAAGDGPETEGEEVHPGVMLLFDAAGRIIVPKSLRVELGLKPGQPLEIRAGDGRLEVEIAATPMQLKKRGKGLVAVAEAELPPLTADQVRETLERVRR